jgi:hypothetical protein
MADRINEGVVGQVRHGINYIIILGTWTIVTTVFFYGASPNLESITLYYGGLAGAKGSAYLDALSREGLKDVFLLVVVVFCGVS